MIKKDLTLSFICIFIICIYIICYQQNELNKKEKIIYEIRKEYDRKLYIFNLQHKQEISILNKKEISKLPTFNINNNLLNDNSTYDYSSYNTISLLNASIWN